MPLVRGYSKQAIAANIKTEAKTKPPSQAVAIALHTADRSRKHMVGHAAMTVGRSKKK